MADPSEFTFAYVVATGERVYIPLAHLDVFPGAYTLDPPAEAHPSARAAKTPKEA